MKTTASAVLFISLASIGPAHSQGTMSGMTSSGRTGALMAPAGQGQGPHDIGKEPGAAEYRAPSGNSEGRTDSSNGMKPGKSSGIAGSGGGPKASGDSGTDERNRTLKK
jgi:hypothetical protein